MFTGEAGAMGHVTRKLWARWMLTVVCVMMPVAGLAHGISEEQKARMLSGGYAQYMVLGAEHMLTGYDHLLFLFGVVFFLTTFRDVAKFVTAFTLGHCLTLIFATFFGITWNYYLVDAIIALSVMYKAFDNNGGFEKHLGMKSPNLIAMVFAFGLLHGFGLSTRLQQLPLGDDNMGILLRILSFNVGVEVGQVLALTVMVFLLSAWRRKESFKRFSFASNSLLMYAGIYLLFMQMHGYWHDSNPDEFRFPEAEHRHVHEDMDIDNLQKESGRENLE
jgi:hypothetical protein